MFKDPAFQKYHGKFTKPTDADITRDMYECASYYQKAKGDTLSRDSLELNSEEIILDENGEPVVQKSEKTEEHTPADPSSKEHKPHKPSEQAIKFDDL